MDVLRVVGECLVARARRVDVQQLRVLVAADVSADDELTWSRPDVDSLRPIGRRDLQLRPCGDLAQRNAPHLGHPAQVGDEYQARPVGVEPPRIRRAHAQQLLQVHAREPSTLATPFIR